jgi:8-oxo-dGTP pyrophosphatase MutT (NUDIX family)
MKKTNSFEPLNLNLISKIEDYLASQPSFCSLKLYPFFINGHQYGWLERTIADELLSSNKQWTQAGDRIELQGENLSAQLQPAALHLHSKGFILGWRHENYGVYADDINADFSVALCALERASFRRFGFLSRAVHINAYYPDGAICLGQRSASKSIDPNKLDNMTAGGIPLGESIYDCAIRELAEEAGVTFDIAKNIQFIETIHIRRNESDGTHNEILYCFDLALPEDFKPSNQDGEVAAFFRLDQTEVIKKLKDMTWDAGKVTASFLLRLGRIQTTIKN